MRTTRIRLPSPERKAATTRARLRLRLILPHSQEGDLTITDSNNEYVYQATGLLGYLTFTDLTIQDALREQNRLEPSFEDYTVQFATVDAYYAGDEGNVLVEAKSYRHRNKHKHPERGRLCGENDPQKRRKIWLLLPACHPRPVTVTVNNDEKTYGDPVPDFKYHTNLVTVVGSAAAQRETEQRGQINDEKGFFQHDVEEGYPQGALYRAQGEDVGSYYYSLNTFTAGPNYILTVSSDTMFTINPKSLCAVEDGKYNSEKPDTGITVTCKEQVEYTGYP